jgi:hypothetical protein
VSPFINLPTATTLPYTYKGMPSTLPPSSTGITSASDLSGGTGASSSGGPEDDYASPPKPKYVISGSGHAAHPDDIVASCRALQAHIAKLQADADADLRALEDRIRVRELAEKRRVAPGWLDSEARILEPERKNGGSPADLMSGGSGGGAPEDISQQFSTLSFGNGHGSGGISYQDGHGPGGASEMAVPDEGVQLDKAFGNITLGSR